MSAASHSTQNGSASNGRFPFVRNWISLAGVIVLLGSIFAFILLFILDLLAPVESPYLGILTYVVAPGFFIFGLFLMGLGRLLYRRQLAHAAPGAPLPRLIIDLNHPRHRRYLAAFLFGAVLFFFLTAIGSYETYHVTKSVQFCGQACHTPMDPQFVAYQHSPHARVQCTECHIGAGAANFVKAKFNGLNQLYAAVFDTFERPIRSRHTIPINQQTCEQCHWPAKYVGNLDRTYSHFLADATNTPYAVRLLLKVGGGDPTHGPVGGIHWHMNVGNKVEFIATDPLKQKIPWVRLTEASGQVTEFRTAGFTNDPSKHTIHTMDCMDCHNRPAHQFRAPNDAVDLAMALGKISTRLPAIKKEAALALIGATAAPAAPGETNNADRGPKVPAQPISRSEGLQKIATALRAKYGSHPDLESTIAAVQEIYHRNFFPEMKSDWRTHPNNIGHKDWPGCFRCHDGEHASPDRKLKIKADDCNACHIILAEGRGEDLEKLNPKGGEFKHPEKDWDVLKCHDCHNGSASAEEAETEK